MKSFFLFLTLLVLVCSWTPPAIAQNPFTSKTPPTTPMPMIKSPVFVKIILWQHQLKEKLSQLIRGSRNEKSVGPLILLMGLAFAYGAVHAAGPGHGKVVAISYVLSHQPSLSGGLVFGVSIALIHGFSGIFGVLGLSHIIQHSVSDTLVSVTGVTQIVSYGLIILLGLGILTKHIFTMVADRTKRKGKKPQIPENSWPWAVAVGIVPCPAVLMVMLFSISMEVPLLGFFLAVCISLGMAATLSLVIITLILGKTGAVRTVSRRGFERAQGVVGMLSGAAITAFGVFFLLPVIHTAIY
jgi:ABC-type nickel/cobalt efflux system permease component RcnA